MTTPNLPDADRELLGAAAELVARDALQSLAGYTYGLSYEHGLAWVRSWVRAGLAGDYDEIARIEQAGNAAFQPPEYEASDPLPEPFETAVIAWSVEWDGDLAPRQSQPTEEDPSP